jgi:hypothetical protein
MVIKENFKALRLAVMDIMALVDDAAKSINPRLGLWVYTHDPDYPEDSRAYFESFRPHPHQVTESNTDHGQALVQLLEKALGFDQTARRVSMIHLDALHEGNIDGILLEEFGFKLFGNKGRNEPPWFNHYYMSIQFDRRVALDVTLDFARDGEAKYKIDIKVMPLLGD